MARIAPHARDIADDAPLRASPAPAGERPIAFRALAWTECDTAEFITRWDALAQWAAEPNPFCESWFLLASLRALDPDGEVRLLCLEVDGQLAGLMPVRRYPSYYGYPLPHLRNWVHDNAFCGLPLVARGLEARFWSELLAWCDGNAGTALFLHLTQMPADGVLHTALQSLVAGKRRRAATVLSEERALLSSRLSPEDYLEQSMTGKKRKELRRQQRRLAEEGDLTLERVRDPEQVADWTTRFLALEQRGWKGAAGSALACDPANQAMFCAALQGAAEQSRLECLTLRQGERDLAMLATFRTPPGAFSYKTAFDEDFARFSPGVLLQCENLEVLRDAYIEWTDSCAVQDHAMIDHIWRERRRIARHSIAIGGSARQRLFGLLARHETGHNAWGIT